MFQWNVLRKVTVLKEYFTPEDEILGKLQNLFHLRGRLNREHK